MTTCARCRAELPPTAATCPDCGAPAATVVSRVVPMTPPRGVDVGELLGRVRHELRNDYEVHAELGRGGMAVVYRATEMELLRPVALKVLPPDLAASPALAERFKREARMAASFDHPNIIPIYRVGQAGGLFFIAMKFIEGKSLDDVIQKQGALPTTVVMHVLRAAVRALAFAHQNNVVHRDIKGANILIDQDARVVVTDFGIARAGEDANLTATGSLMGTPYFMSPEQCAGHRVGQQSDQYSLGIVAFQMLTGTVPFRAETIPGVMQHHFFTPVPDIRVVRSGVPEALVQVVNRALSKRPTDRYATTREMQAAVEAIPFTEAERREGEALLRDLVLGVDVPRVSSSTLPPLADTMMMTPPPLARARLEQEDRKRRRRVLVAAAAGALLVGGAGTAAAWWTIGRANAPAPVPTLAIATPEPAAPAPQVAIAPDTIADSAAADAASDSSSTDALDSARTADAAATRTARAEAPREAARPASSPLSRSVEPPAPAPALSRAWGKIRVRVLPADAEISIDDRLLGRGVVVDSLVAAGSRRLRVTAPGYAQFDSTIVIAAEATSQIGTLRLKPVEARP